MRRRWAILFEQTAVNDFSKMTKPEIRKVIPHINRLARGEKPKGRIAKEVYSQKTYYALEAGPYAVVLRADTEHNLIKILHVRPIQKS